MVKKSFFVEATQNFLPLSKRIWSLLTKMHCCTFRELYSCCCYREINAIRACWNSQLKHDSAESPGPGEAQLQGKVCLGSLFCLSPAGSSLQKFRAGCSCRDYADTVWMAALRGTIHLQACLNAEVKGWLCGKCGEQAAFPSHLALSQGVYWTGLYAASAVISRALMWFSVGQSCSLLWYESQTSLGAQKESYSNSLCVSEAAKLCCLWADEELFYHGGCCQPGEISLCISTSLLPAGLFHSRIILVMVFQIEVLPICSSELLCCSISTAFNKICHVLGGVSFLLFPV